MDTATEPCVAHNEVRSSAIAAEVLRVFDLLDRNGKPEYPRYTVLAGIVAVIHGRVIKVISLATGTKCAGENILSASSVVLVDSHAEVLARRAFQRYLYACIRLCFVDSSFLGSEACPLAITKDSKRLMWKGEWKLYLYSSDSPCGDAAIYDRSYGLSFSGKKSRRVCNETETSVSTVVEPGAVRMKPGRLDIPENCRTISMSCSDKIAKWIFLGIQGGLLSLLVEPIFLTGVVVGSDPFALPALQQLALQRALVNRIPDSDYLKASVTLSDVLFPLGKCSSEQTERTMAEGLAGESTVGCAIQANKLQPHELSINWILALPSETILGKSARAGGSVEITISRTGIVQGSSIKVKNSTQTSQTRGMSRLCSRSLFSMFIDTTRNVSEAYGIQILDSSWALPPEILVSFKTTDAIETATDTSKSIKSSRYQLADLTTSDFPTTSWKAFAHTYNARKKYFLSVEPFSNWTTKKKAISFSNSKAP